MPTPPKGPRLGKSPSHERLMLANLAAALFAHGRIRTTQTKAKRLRPFAERLITKARKADLHNRREVMKVIRDKDVVHRLFAEIGPHFADRAGGYTRIIKTMPRKGDNAPMAVIELVPERTATAEAEQARGTRFARDEEPTPTPTRDEEPTPTPTRDQAATTTPETTAATTPAPTVAANAEAAAPAEGADTEPVDESETAEAVDETAAAGAVTSSPAATAPEDAADSPPAGEAAADEAEDEHEADRRDQD